MGSFCKERFRGLALLIGTTQRQLGVDLTRFGAGLWAGRSHRARAQTSTYAYFAYNSEAAPFYCSALSTEHSLQPEPIR
jgi:hypothetical protein